VLFFGVFFLTEGKMQKSSAENRCLSLTVELLRTREGQMGKLLVLSLEALCCLYCVCPIQHSCLCAFTEQQFVEAVLDEGIVFFNHL